MTRTVLWAGRQVSGAMTVMENFVLLDGHDIHMKPFPNVQLPNGFPDPAVRDLHLEDRIVIAQRNVIKNMVRAVSNGSPEAICFSGYTTSSAPLHSRNLACTSRAALATTFLAPNSFKREAVSREL